MQVSVSFVSPKLDKKYELVLKDWFLTIFTPVYFNSKSNRPRSAHIPRTNTQNNIKNEFAKCSSIDKILSSTSKKAIGK